MDNAVVTIDDGMPPSVEEGRVKSIREIKAQRSNKYHAKVLITIIRNVAGRRSSTDVPFHFGARIWGQHRKALLKGGFWRVHFRITGNLSGGVHYCNAEVIAAHEFKAVELESNRSLTPKYEMVGKNMPNTSNDLGQNTKSAGTHNINNFIDEELRF